MKKFTTQEIRDLFNRVMIGEISFPEMVKVINERVSESEVSEFKDGDFVYEDGRIMIIKSYPNMCHALIYPEIGLKVLYNKSYARTIFLSELSFRVATQEEKQLLIDAMAKDGKRWNEEEKCVEDIPKCKFKKGDKVRIKHGVSSKTNESVKPFFLNSMDKLIGKELTVKYCSNGGVVMCDGYLFSEDWLEPYVEELKKGDLAIFWDETKGYSIVRFYERSNGSDEYYKHTDDQGFNWANAIKFESKEQYERFIKGEI